MTVLIAGGGIAGLALGLTCHQIGVPFQIFEASQQIRPLGVGINLQPTAVRELYDLGLQPQLDAIGIKTRDYGMYTKTGGHVWTEPRGTWAGYNWPQYSVHRGKLHQMLYDALFARAGAECVMTGCSVTGFSNSSTGVHLTLKDKTGHEWRAEGQLAIGADGIHSAVRAQMIPNEGPAKWGGAILWRGTTQAEPFLTGASMVMIGGRGLRFVSYPISHPDPATRLATINWIAILDVDPDHPFRKESYSRQANLDDFLPQFEKLNLDWIDIAGLIKGADAVFEYPLVDRDPLTTWTQGRVSLIGDAAHAAYPVGSNGAGSAIIDARVLGAAFLNHGLTQQALRTYEDATLPGSNKVVLMNRTAGPDSILDRIDDLSGGEFTHISDIISGEDLAAHAARYKATAGFGIDQANQKPRTIPAGAVLDKQGL